MTAQTIIALLPYTDRNAKPTVVQLAKGSVEEVQVKGQEHCLKLTSTIQGERSIYISFMNAGEYNKWIKKAKKVRILQTFVIFQTPCSQIVNYFNLTLNM